MSVADGRAKGVTGGGAVPPPDAPRETAQPLQHETIAIQQERARANEKTLPPFNPQGMRRAAPSVAPVAPPPPTPSATEALIADLFGSDAPRTQPTDPLGGLDPMQSEVDQ